METYLRTPILAFAALVIPAVPASSQVPDGWVVVSSYRTTTSPLPGDGGLWLVHPRVPVPPIPVSGLGPDLTGAGMPAPSNHGANCVVRRPSDGALLVGELADPGHQVDLHLIQLSGTSVPPGGDVTFACGVAGPSVGGIHQLAILPSGEVLVAVGSIAQGPLAGERLGRVNLVTGAVTPVQVLGAEGAINALALHSSGSSAYLGLGHSGGTGSLWTVPVPGGGPASFVASLPAPVVNLAVDNDGHVLVGCFLPATDLLKVDPATGAVTPVGLTPGIHNALSVERVTGNTFVYEDGPSSTWISLVETAPGGVAVTQLATVPGVLSGIDVNHDPETYGPASPGANEYTWALAPNPGGLPQIGNLGFSLTLESSPKGAPGLLIAGLQPLSPALPVLGGILLNVNPFPIVVSQPLAGLATETIPLPIPNDPSLVWLKLYLQSAHFEPTGFAASSGVELTILH